MSVEVTNVIRTRKVGSAVRKSILKTLGDYADTEWSTFVGQERVAAEVECSVRTVRTEMARFEAEGLITRAKRYGGLHGRTSDRTQLHRKQITDLPEAVSGREAQGPDLPATDDTLPATDDISTGRAVAGETSVETSEESSGKGIPVLVTEPRASLGIASTDVRYPVAVILEDRYRWSKVTEEQWDLLWEEVDNEYPRGTAKGADPVQGWRALAGWLHALPRDAGDPMAALFARQQRLKSKREAIAQERISLSDEHKKASLHPSVGVL